ncbi:MAG TPA: hypothetical protein DCX67_00845, partial [Opitutae bacterium]|nr:hypothetical protein [Opitutae bacterium]
PQSGNWIYTPSANYFGNDSFEVIVTDDSNASTFASIVLSIISVNDVPEALELIGLTIPENMPPRSVVGYFEAIDHDQDSNLTFSLVEGNGSTHNHLFFIDANNNLNTRQSFDYEAEFAFVREKVIPFDHNKTTVPEDAVPAQDPAENDDLNSTFAASNEDENGTAESIDENLSLPIPQDSVTSSALDGNESAQIFDANESFVDSEDNGSRRSGQALGPEVEPTYFRIRARVEDQHGASAEKSFVIRLLNKVEDYDSDGIENAYDPDDALFEMPALGTVEVTVRSNGRIFLTSGFSPGRNRSLPEFTFLIAEDEDFNRTIRTLPAAFQNGRIHATLYDLKPGRVYHTRVLSTHRAKRLLGPVTIFDTPSVYTYWWQGHGQIQGNWRQSWLGIFLPHRSGWIYHTELHWLFAHAGKDGDLWLWSDKLGWIWTSEGVYPHLYGNTKANWFFFFKNIDGQAILFDYSAGGIVTIGE